MAQDSFYTAKTKEIVQSNSEVILKATVPLLPTVATERC